MRKSIFLLVVSFFQFVTADETLGKRAEHVLNSVVYRIPVSIIGEREWQELQLDRLVTMLDRTTTSFGRWGLVKLLHPIANKYQLEQRKKIITFLLDNPDTMDLFQTQLEHIKRVEKSLLAYWDKDDLLDRSCEQFYFSAWWGLNELNESSVALNVSTATEIFNTFKYLLTALALGGIATEISQWVYSEQKDFNILRGLKTGFAMPLRQHSWYPAEIDERAITYNLKDYIKAFAERGSWYDKYLVLSKGYSFEGIADAENLQKYSIKLGTFGGLIGATIPTLFFDYQWGSAIVSVGKRIVAMNRDLNQLQQRILDVAHCCDAIMELQKIVASQDGELASYFDVSDNDVVDLFFKKLFTKRFLQTSNYVYSRGHVLAMHQNIKRIKRLLVPLLHSIALLDAYCSIAQLYKEHQNGDVVFSFPEFVNSPTPLIQYYDAWLPLLQSDSAVTNNLFLGKAQSKMIITGPNGGGKSTILKTYGVAAVLAQSWGIVPAQKAQQTLFTSIRTSLAPHEDLEQGLSTFMAEKKVISELTDDIRRSDGTHSMLVLIDEPYKGTVDDESAKRIYQFGKDIAGYSQALVGIATHVKKPIMLEYDTGGIFGNYQVEINEIDVGIFERLFKLAKGPATWWFEDTDQRSRFIDWISVEAAVSN
jgi:MutS domain V